MKFIRNFVRVTRELTHHTIKSTILSYLPNARIVLFGSRARGMEDSQSDYDLLVIIPEVLNQREKIDWSSKIDQAIVKAIHAPVDILLYSDAEIRQKQQLPGHIVNSAIREGVAL